jgi:hypothetical protein
MLAAAAHNRTARNPGKIFMDSPFDNLCLGRDYRLTFMGATKERAASLQEDVGNSGRVWLRAFI